MARITLKAARVNLGLTQAEIADRMGVSRQTVFEWENGKREIKPAYLYMFCGIAGVSEDDIILPVVTT